jgi:hypothetical protein
MVFQLGKREVVSAGIQASSCDFDDMAPWVPQPYGRGHKNLEVGASQRVSGHAVLTLGVLSFTSDGSY